MVDFFGIDLFIILKLTGEFVLLPIIVIYLYDFVNFLKCFNNLCDEIDENYYKIQKKQIDEQLTRTQEIWNKHMQNPFYPEWIGFAKKISIWILSEKNDTVATDYYRYLSNNELKNFIRQGFYRFIKTKEETLTHFYLDCDTLSIEEQNVEKAIMREVSPQNYSSTSLEDKKRFFDRKISEISHIANVYGSLISSNYEDIHPYFRKSLVHVIQLYLSENILIEKCRKIQMKLSKSSNCPTWIFIDLLVMFVCIAGFFLSNQWANSDPTHVQWAYIILLASFIGFVISFIGLPLSVIHWWGNQNVKLAIQNTIFIILSFVLLIIFYAILDIFFPNAPKYMINGATAFISALIGGLVVQSIIELKKS